MGCEVYADRFAASSERLDETNKRQVFNDHSDIFSSDELVDECKKVV